MGYETILIERRNASLWLYLNRPDALNAITSKMMIEIAQVLREAARDDRIFTLVISAKGRAFCAGADLKDVPSQQSVRQGEKGLFEYSDEMVAVLSVFPKPVIAALNGVTCAGGLEIALWADIIVAAEHARIGDVHSNFGLLPGMGGAVNLVRAVGPQRARYLMLSGDLLTADELREWGLVARVFAADRLEAEVQELADRMAKKSLSGLRYMRDLVRNSMDQPLDPALAYEAAVFRSYYQSVEVAEGQAAFREKRDPDFSSKKRTRQWNEA